MAILWAGTSIADLTFPGPYVVSTNATYVDTSVAREGFTDSNTGTTCHVDLPSAASDFWISFVSGSSSATSATASIVEFYSTSFSTTQALFRIRRAAVSLTTAGVLSADYWNGSSWVQITNSTVYASGTQYRFSVRIRMNDTTGAFAFYTNGGEQGTGLVNADTILTAATNINRIQFSNWSAVSAFFSEIIVADEDTRNMRLAALSPTADGANTAWTGTFADVDETGATDSDYLTSGTNGQKDTFVMSDIHSSVSTMGVHSVVVSARARRGTTGPANLKTVARISGTDYSSANLSGIDTGLRGLQSILATNPATSSAWTQSAVNGAEFGVESAA